MKIEVTRILPNPHRNLTANPIRPEQVDNILESIERTGFWDNLVVRESPDRPGFYELAYGHHRMAAVVKAGITHVDLPVRDLNDWEMYECMVDENNTQAIVTPAVVFENIGVGAHLLEQYIRDSETVEEFNGKVSMRSARNVSTFDNHQTYSRIRNSVLAGEGVGKDLVMTYVPSASKSAGVVQTVVDSIYGRSQVEPEILKSFNSPSTMAAFAASVKRLDVPKKMHKKLASVALENEWSQKAMATNIDVWVDVESGASAKRLAKVLEEKKQWRFDKAYNSGNFNNFCHDYVRDLEKLNHRTDVLRDNIIHGDENLRIEIIKDMQTWIDKFAEIVELAGAPDAVKTVDITPAKPKMLSHR
jgi:ParB/RepB/Spo0J family partition protein